MLAFIQHIFGTSISDTQDDVSGILGIVVDRSGSMISMHTEVVNGINALIADQKALLGNKTNTSVFISQFDNKVEDVLENVPIHEMPTFDKSNFTPRGMTALLDAIHHMIHKISKHVDDTPPSKNSFAQPVIVIMTDGDENSSTVPHSAVLRSIIEKKTAGWKFTFMGCSANAMEVGKCMGFDKERCLSYQNNGHSQSNAWRAVSAQVSRTMSFPNDDESVGFTDVERHSTQTS